MSRTERLALAVAVCCFALGYALYGLFRHWHFNSSAYDLGIFDQVVWHLSRFETPGSTIRGFSHFLGDHFFPIIVLFAPLYWIAPRPETLIVAQALLFAVSIVPVYLFARDRLPHGPSLLLVVAYACFWGLQRANAFDVHETAFAPLAIATMILSMDRRRWMLFWLAVGFTLLVKEDHIALLGGVGLYLLLQREWKHGATAIASSAVAFLIVVGMVIPAFSDSGVYGYTSAYGDLVSRPWEIPLRLVSPAVKIETAVLWFLPFACAPLASPLAVLVVPLAMTRFLSVNPIHWGTVFHYSAPFAPILAMAAADGLARLERRLSATRGAGAGRRFVVGVAAASVVLSAILPGRQPLWRVFSPEHYRPTAVQAIGPAVVAMVPPEASVVAQAAILPHLSARHHAYVLGPAAPEADYVLMAEGLSPWPAATVAELRTLIEARRRHGYTVIFDQGGWIVLRR